MTPNTDGRPAVSCPDFCPLQGMLGEAPGRPPETKPAVLGPDGGLNEPADRVFST